MEKKKKRYGAMNKVGNEPTLLAKEQMVDSALKAGSLTGGGGYTAASTEQYPHRRGRFYAWELLKAKVTGEKKRPA